MKNSIDEIITAYAEFNVYCDELSQTQSDIMPALTKDMKEVLKNAKTNLKTCDKEIAELTNIKQSMQNCLDESSRYKEIYNIFKKHISDDEIKNNLLEQYPNIIDDVEKCYSQLNKLIENINNHLKEIEIKIEQLHKLRKEIAKSEHNRLERERRNGYFLFVLILCAFQIIFTFKDYNLVFKILDCLISSLLVSYFIAIIIRISKNDRSTKKYQIFVIILNIITSLTFIILSNCLTFDIRAKYSLLFYLYFLNMIEYQLIETFLMTKIFTSEFFFRIIILISVWGTVCGIFIYWFTLNLLLLKFAIACIYILIILTSVNFIFFKKEPFFNKKFRNTLLYKFLLVLIYGMAIFLFPYYIKWCGLDGCDFEIFITIYSCVIGGLLTLGGVAWTIKQADKQRNEDKILENKPLFYPIVLSQRQLSQSNVLEIAFVGKEDKNADCVIMGVIENSDNSIVVIDKLIINDNEYKPINHAIISKSNRYKILIKTNNGLIKDDIRLVVKDVLNNQYCYKIEVFETLKNGRKTKNILSIEEEKEED